MKPPIPAPEGNISPRPDTFAVEAPAVERVAGKQLRVSMERAVAAWGFGAAFFNVTSGAVYAAFVRSLSTNDFLFGVLAASLPFMSILQVVAAHAVERTGRRKRQMVTSGIIARSLWLCAALLPLAWMHWPHHVSKAGMFNLMLMLIATSGVFQAFTGPSFFAWMADLVPERVRPRFFAQRMRAGTVAALMVSIGVGLIADRYPYLPVYCAILAVASLAGIIDAAMFIGVREPARVVPAASAAPTRRMSLWECFREPLTDPAVRRFLRFVALLASGYSLQGAFLWLHALEYLKLSKTVTGLIVNGAPLLGIWWGLTFWSGVIKRHGTRPVMRMCSAGLCVIPFGWLLAQPHEFISLLLFTFVSGFLAGGIDLANQNLITGLAPQVSRANLTALFSVAAGLSAAAASVCGGALAQFLQGIHYNWAGITIINYHVLFLCSLLVRIVNASLVAPRLQEPNSTATLETVKEIMPEVAQSVADALARPLRPASDAKR